MILLWLSLTALLALLSAGFSLSLAGTATWGTTEGLRLRDAEHAGLIVNCVVMAIALGASLGLGLLRPAWWRRGLLALALFPLPILAWTSGNIRAALIVLATYVSLAWLGREVVTAFLRDPDRATAWVLGSALGIGGIAILGFALGNVGLLRARVIVPILGLIVLALLLRARGRLIDDVAALQGWVRSPIPRDPFRLLLGGLLLAYFWLAFCGALAPETISDAVTARIPAAAMFARAGRLTIADPELFVARDPAVGEATYAFVLALGPLATAKLLNFAVALCCAALMFTLGKRLAGDMAGLLATTMFWTMPIVFWLAQTAYLDLFTTLYTLAAAVIICRRRLSWHVSSLAGICIGLGVGTKLHFGYVAVGLAVVMGIVALHRVGLLAALRLVLLLTFVAGAVVAVPLARVYNISGQLAGFTLATEALSRTDGETPVALNDLTTFGYGRSLKSLLLVPLNLTINSHKFEWVTSRWGPVAGFLGYVLLGVLPLLLLRPRRPYALALGAGAAAAFLLWFYSAQYLRYGLPIFALLCPLGALAFAAGCRRFTSRMSRSGLRISLALLLAVGVVVQLRVPNLAWRFALGQQDTATYLAQYQICCNGYRLLQELDAQPDATRAFVVPDPARLYTRVRMSSPFTLGPGNSLSTATTEQQALAALDAGGYSHLIINRSAIPLAWARMIVVQEEFLRRNTVLIDGENNTYLFRLLPPGERGHGHPWEEGPELLTDGGFEVQTGQGTPVWTVVNGSPHADISGAASRSGQGAFLVAPGDRLVTTVAVMPQVRYLLSHETRAQADDAHAALWIEWRDAAGRPLFPTIEAVPASGQAYHRFSILAPPPPSAVTATIILESHDAPVWFDDVSLRVATAIDSPGSR